MFFDVMINEVYQSIRRETLVLRKVVTRIELKKINKGAWGMPRLSEAKKDVPSCEKLRGSAEEI
jgi:hypothetical protein